MSVTGTSLGRGFADDVRRNFAEDRTTAIVATLFALGALFYPFIDRALGLNAINEMIPTAIYILLALGLNIVVGYAGLLDLGYAAFFAIGAYTIALLTSPLSPFVSALPFQVNFWVALVLAFFVAMIFGVILGAPTLRLRGDYLAIVTLGFGEIVPLVFLNAQNITRGSQGLNAIGQPQIFGFEIRSSQHWWYLIMVSGLLLILLARRLRDSRLGRAWMAMREDEIAAAAMGIDLVRTKLFAFALGASFSGIAGVIYASRYSYANPQSFEFGTSVLLLAMVILGGLGNIWGVILGGLLLGVFDRILATRITGWLRDFGETANIGFLQGIDLGQFRFGIFGLTLVLMMLLRPEGILPNERRRAELHESEEESPGPMSGEAYEMRDEPL